jgi:hypothetical protein
VTGNRASGVRLVHDHVNILPAALMAAKAADQPPHREGLAKSLGKLARAQDRCVLALEADCPDIEPGADLITDRCGQSLTGLGHIPGRHENVARTPAT